MGEGERGNGVAGQSHRHGRCGRPMTAMLVGGCGWAAIWGNGRVGSGEGPVWVGVQTRWGGPPGNRC